MTRACYLATSARYNDLTSYPGHRSPMKGDQHEAPRRARRCRLGACVHRAPARVRRETEAERAAVGGDDTERDGASATAAAARIALSLHRTIAIAVIVAVVGREELGGVGGSIGGAAAATSRSPEGGGAGVRSRSADSSVS